MKNIAILFIITILISGCAIVQEQIHSNRPDASEITTPLIKNGMSLIHLYRASNNPTVDAGEINIYVDNKYILSVLNEGYTWLYLKPGTYTFKATWNIIDKPLFEGDLYDTKELTLTIEENKQYYINYEIKVGYSPYSDVVRFTGLVGKVIEPVPADSSVEFILENESRALYHIEDCRVQTNELNKNIQ